MKRIKTENEKKAQTCLILCYSGGNFCNLFGEFFFIF